MVSTLKPRGTPYNGLYGEASPKRPLPFRLQVIERVRIKPVEAYEGVGKSSFVYVKAQKS